MSYFTAENDVNVDGKAQNQTIWSLNSRRLLMKKKKLWIPAHGFVKDSRAQWMSYVISCHKSVLLFEKTGKFERKNRETLNM